MLIQQMRLACPDVDIVDITQVYGYPYTTRLPLRDESRLVPKIGNLVRDPPSFINIVVRNINMHVPVDELKLFDTKWIYDLYAKKGHMIQHMHEYKLVESNYDRNAQNWDVAFWVLMLCVFPSWITLSCFAIGTFGFLLDKAIH